MSGKYGYINLVVTRKGHRGRGIARRLVQEALKVLKEKGVKYVKANVYNSNPSAIKMWKRLGFKAESSIMAREAG